MQAFTDLHDELVSRARIEGDGYIEEVGFVEAPEGPMFAVLTLPSTPATSAIVLCPSLFELNTLQSTELMFLRRAARAGCAGIYIQPPGVGESGGDPGITTLASRIEAAQAGWQQLSDRVPGVAMAFFGARFGAVVAAQCAATTGGAGLIAWDPSFEIDAYLKQIRRLVRISGVAGGSTAIADPWQRIREVGRASVLGIETTKEQLEDLGSAQMDLSRIESPSLVVVLGNRAAAAAAAHLAGVSDLEVVELPGRDLAGLGMSVREAPEAIEPTIAWIERKLG